MEKLYLEFKYLKSNKELWNETTTVDSYVVCKNYEELYSIISTFCFTEKEYQKSVRPIDDLFDNSDTNLDYDDWVETLTENDYQTMCEQFKQNYKINYFSFDVEHEISQFPNYLKEQLSKYTPIEQKAIVLAQLYAHGSVDGILYNVRYELKFDEPEMAYISNDKIFE